MPLRLMHWGGVVLLALGAVVIRPEAAAKTPLVMPLTFPGATSTTAIGINSEGNIVGNYVDNSFCFHGFLLAAGSYVKLDVPNATVTVARGINPLGDIVGFYSNADASRVCIPGAVAAPCPGCQGFLLRNGVYTAINVPFAGTTNTRAFGINPQGDIVGRYTGGDGLQHGFLRSSGGTYTPIDFKDSLGNKAALTNAFGINPRGEIVGTYSLTDPTCNSDCHSFLLLTDGTFTPLIVAVAVTATRGASPRVLARGINDRGDIAGSFDDGSGNDVPFLLELDDRRSSTLAVPASNSDAFGINARGDIVGDYEDTSSVTHGFFLTRAL